MASAAKSAQPAQPVEAKPTDYIILEEREVQINGSEPTMGWVPVAKSGKPRIFQARSPQAAIEGHAGKVGDAKAKPGRYKAVAWSAWKGIVDIPEPTQIAVQKPTFVTDE